MDSDSDYFRYPVGSPEHYAAYAKEFGANHGIGYVYPDNPGASYVVDHAYELAYIAEEYAGDPDADTEAEEDAGEKGPWVPYLDDEGNWIPDPAHDKPGHEPPPEWDIDLEPF
jgi:hypothetical protein